MPIRVGMTVLMRLFVIPLHFLLAAFASDHSWQALFRPSSTFIEWWHHKKIVAESVLQLALIAF